MVEAESVTDGLAAAAPSYAAEIERRVAERVDAIKVGWPVACSLSGDLAKVLVTLPIEGKARGARHVTIEASPEDARDLALSIGTHASKAHNATELARWTLERLHELAAPQPASGTGMREAVTALAHAVALTALERWVQVYGRTEAKEEHKPGVQRMAEALRHHGVEALLTMHSRAADILLSEMLSGAATGYLLEAIQALGPLVGAPVEMVVRRASAMAPTEPAPSEASPEPLTAAEWLAKKRREAVYAEASPEPAATADVEREKFLRGETNGEPARNIPPSAPASPAAASDSPPDAVTVSLADLESVLELAANWVGQEGTLTTDADDRALQRVRAVVTRGLFLGPEATP